MAAGRCVEVRVVVHHGTTGKARMANVLARERALGLLLLSLSGDLHYTFAAPLTGFEIFGGWYKYAVAACARSPSVRRDLQEARHGAGERAWACSSAEHRDCDGQTSTRPQRLVPVIRTTMAAFYR